MASNVVTFSGGVVGVTKETAGNATVTLTHADEALYRAKQQGRNKIQKWSGNP